MEEECDGRPYRLVFKLRPYESVIFSVPYHESTEEEKENERRAAERARQDYEDAVSDNKYVPKVPAPSAEAKPAAKKKGVTIAKLRARKPAAQKNTEE